MYIECMYRIVSHRTERRAVSIRIIQPAGRETCPFRGGTAHLPGPPCGVFSVHTPSVRSGFVY
eukprot:COSAG02_NODE_664_length_18739_cov_11.071567_22_plen_63_part_00